MDRCGWGMSDGWVGCEWVSVSSGTGLPGLSPTKGFACVRACVCLWLTELVPKPQHVKALKAALQPIV